MQVSDGTYLAHPTGKVIVGEHTNGCLVCQMEFAFDDTAQTIANVFWLTQKDGALSTRNIDTLKDLFGWNGQDFFWLEDHAEEFKEVPVELVIENESFTDKNNKEHISPKIKWVNKPGGATIPGCLEVYNAIPDGHTMLSQTPGTTLYIAVFCKKCAL